MASVDHSFNESSNLGFLYTKPAKLQGLYTMIKFFINAFDKKCQTNRECLNLIKFEFY